MSTVIPFGYGFRESMATLKALMEDSNTYLADIRKSPFSGYPGYNGHELEAAFPKRYVHVSELGNLNHSNGGPIRIAKPIQGIDRLVKGLNKGYRLILLCGCREFNDCHRRLVTEMLQKTMPEVEVLQPDEVKSNNMGKSI